MSFSEVGVLALAVYLTVLLGVAEVANRARRELTPSDHFLGGRELGVFVLFLTLYATAYSGNSLLGYPGRAYRTGFSFVMATGFMMAIIVTFHALVPRLRPAAIQRGYVTPGDFLRDRFGGSRSGRILGFSVAMLMVFALANFLLAQLKAMGYVASLVTGDLVPYSWGVIGLAGLILFYETRGGMRAVAWTDAAQGILMAVGLLTLLVWLLVGSGGMTQITLEVSKIRPEAVAVPDLKTSVNWFSTIALLGLGSVVYPQAIQRIYAARTGRALSQSFALMTYMPLLTTFVVTLIGIAAITRLEVGTGIDADGVMPLLLNEWAQEGPISRVGAVVVFIGALSAIMSTADSCLLSLGSLLARDVFGRTGDGAKQAQQGKWLAGLVLVAMIPLALHRDVTLWRLIELKMEILIQCVPAFLLALHWSKQTATATLMGLVVGTILSVGLTYLGFSQVFGVHAGVAGLVLNCVVVVIGSYWKPSLPVPVKA